jgi:hypothetical protein
MRCTVRVELLRRVATVVGKLLDEELVAVAKLVLGHVRERERVPREVLEEILERDVGQTLLVRPRGVTEDAVEAAGVGCLDGAKRRLQLLADVLRGSAHVLPVGALGDDEPIVCSRRRVRGVTFRLGEGAGMVLVPHVRQPLEEDQRENELLVVAGIDEAAQDDGSSPEIRFEFLLGHALAHDTHPPSCMTRRRLSSASRHCARASLKAATASGSGGMSAPIGGST